MKEQIKISIELTTKLRRYVSEKDSTFLAGVVTLARRDSLAQSDTLTLCETFNNFRTFNKYKTTFKVLQ